MKSIGFDNSVASSEFIYNGDYDTIYIIEINPRMASQFADLYEKVDGVNSYSYVLDLAAGKKPQMRRRQGKYNVAASFVLRRFDNTSVVRVPSDDEVKQVYEQFPDVRVQIDQDTQLRRYGVVGAYPLKRRSKDRRMDYRYGLIHLGARSKRALYKKYEACRLQLPFSFAYL